MSIIEACTDKTEPTTPSSRIGIHLVIRCSAEEFSAMHLTQKWSTNNHPNTQSISNAIDYRSHLRPITKHKAGTNDTLVGSRTQIHLRKQTGRHWSRSSRHWRLNQDHLIRISGIPHSQYTLSDSPFHQGRTTVYGELGCFKDKSQIAYLIPFSIYTTEFDMALVFLTDVNDSIAKEGSP